MPAILIPLLLLAPRLTSFADTLPPPGILEGRVASSLDQPIAQATVEVTPDRSQFSDSTGGFRFSGLEPGTYSVSVRAIGFTSRSISVSLSGGSGWRGMIMLEPSPQPLPDVVASAQPYKPAEYNGTTRYDDFFRRKAKGSGQFLDRAAIQQRNAGTLFQLMQGMPGVRVKWSPPGAQQTATMHFARCPGTPPQMAIYLDGLRIHWDMGIRWDSILEGDLEERRRAHEAFAEAMESISPADVEMMEIYRGVSELPSDIRDRDVCAAAVVYSRWHGK